MSQLTSGIEDSDEDNGELQTILETMMQHLMSKEILYEPLKELHDKVGPLHLTLKLQNLRDYYIALVPYLSRRKRV